MNLKRRNNICNGVFPGLAVLLCLFGIVATAESQTQVVTLPSDTVVVPMKYDRGQSGQSRLVLVDPGMESSRLLATKLQTQDSLPSQVFRVQLYTSKLYGDATRMTRIGRELCLPPVTLDYDVPYYKVRAGAFATRVEAESHVSRAKSLGFTEAWVVITANPLHKSTSDYSDSTTTASDGPANP